MRNGGVFYGSVSAYLSLPPSSYRVRVIGGMATSCTATPLLPFEIPLTPIGAGRHYTVLAAADAEREMGSRLARAKLSLIEDDLETQAGQVRLRFVNGSQDVPSADFGAGEMAAYQQLFKDAAYGTFGPATSGGGPYTILVAMPVS